MNYKTDIQPQLEYGIKLTNNSHYKVLKLTPVSGNLTNFTSSSQTSTWELPSMNCYNFSKMYLNFTRGSIAKMATGNIAVVNSYIPYIDRVILKTQSGVILCDVSNIDVYSRLSMPLLNNFRENTQLNSALYPTYSIVTNPSSNDLASNDPYIDNKLDGTTKHNDGNSTIGAQTLLRYGNYDFSGYNKDLNAKNINIQLSDLLRDEIFGIDKNLWVGRNLYLQIVWRPYKNWVYIIDQAAEVPTQFKMLNTDKTITCTNLTLNVYCEANPFIVESIKAKQAEKNFCIVKPELKDNNIVISNSQGDRSVLVKVLNPGNGMLYSFYAGLVNGNRADFYTTNNTSNHNQAKYTDIKLYLNNLQLLDLSSTSNQDLEHLLQYYKNHSFSDYSSFSVCSPFSHIFDCNPRTEKLWDGQSMKGVSFDNSQGEHSLMLTYKLNTPTADFVNNPSNQASFNCFVFSVVLRQIFLNDRGDIQLMPFE